MRAAIHARVLLLTLGLLAVNRSGLRMFWGALWYDTTQRTIYKDCMEARGWTKEEP